MNEQPPCSVALNQASIVVSASTRDDIIRRDGKYCWLCNMHGVHVTQIISSADQLLFEEYHRSKLLHMDSLDKIENLMYLCGNCHYAFDSRVPAWVFLPDNLDFFITKELNFQSQRSVAAGLGLTLSRPNPGTLSRLNPCTGIPFFYRRYQIRPGFLNNNIFLKSAIKFWHGNPIVAILNSASILVAVQRLDPITQGGLPEDVARKFHHLMFLYSSPPPALNSQFAPADTGDIADSRSASGRSSSRCGGDDMGFAPWTQPILPHSGAESTASLLNNNQAPDDQPPWAFGPDMTSGELIEWNMDALEIQAGVDAKIRDGGDEMWTCI